MSKKLIATSTLAAALLVGGLDNSMAIEVDYARVVSQPATSNALTSQQKVLSKKGIHYRLTPSVDTENRVYRVNDSKKSHRLMKKGKSHRTNNVSRPNPSRKIGNGGRFV